MHVNAGVTLDAPNQVQNRGTSVIVKLLDSWIALCEDYLRRERHEIIEQEPSESKLEECRHEVRWLLRSATHLHGLAIDPDYPAPQYADEIAWRMRQLEDSWRSLNNPMTGAEAEAQLKKHFPDDPLFATLVPE